MLRSGRQLVSELPSRSKTRVDLTNAFLDELWNSLQHPPLSYLGDKFQYRQADGSYNVSVGIGQDRVLVLTFLRISCIHIWAPQTPPMRAA